MAAQSKRSASAATVTDRELVITRLFDAPRELVFEMWIRPEHLVHWWGPKDFTTPFFELDLRPGGVWRARIRASDGKEYSHEGVYREIVVPERLVFTHVWLEEPEHETLCTVTFAERRGKTEMTFQQRVFKSVEERDSHEGGWSECFDLLAAYLARS